MDVPVECAVYGPPHEQAPGLIGLLSFQSAMLSNLEYVCGLQREEFPAIRRHGQPFCLSVCQYGKSMDTKLGRFQVCIPLNAWPASVVVII